MEHELWDRLMRAIQDVSRSRRDSAYHTHATALIVRTYLWAVLHHRPTSWACDRRHWDDRRRPATLPSQSTMSRRLRTDAVRSFMDAMGRRLRGDRAWTLLKLIDGKPLTVAKHSADPDARWGWGAGTRARGYKLHAVWGLGVLPSL